MASLEVQNEIRMKEVSITICNYLTDYMVVVSNVSLAAGSVS